MTVLLACEAAISFPIYSEGQKRVCNSALRWWQSLVQVQAGCLCVCTSSHFCSGTAAMGQNLCPWTKQCNEDSGISRSRAPVGKRCKNQGHCCHSRRRAATPLALRVFERLQQDQSEHSSDLSQQRLRRESCLQGGSDRPVERSQNRQAIICDSIRPLSENQDAQQYYYTDVLFYGKTPIFVAFQPEKPHSVFWVDQI